MFVGVIVSQFESIFVHKSSFLGLLIPKHLRLVGYVYGHGRVMLGLLFSPRNYNAKERKDLKTKALATAEDGLVRGLVLLFGLIFMQIFLRVLTSSFNSESRQLTISNLSLICRS